MHLAMAVASQATCETCTPQTLTGQLLRTRWLASVIHTSFSFDRCSRAAAFYRSDAPLHHGRRRSHTAWLPACFQSRSGTHALLWTNSGGRRTAGATPTHHLFHRGDAATQKMRKLKKKVRRPNGHQPPPRALSPASGTQKLAGSLS